MKSAVLVVKMGMEVKKTMGMAQQVEDFILMAQQNTVMVAVEHI